jgi:phytoene synthase
MDEWGVTEDDLRGRRVTPAFRDFMRFQISRARDFYAKANRGIALLPDDGSRYCVRLMSDLYSRILRAIEANDYEVFERRAHVPLPSKLLFAAMIAVRREGLPYFLLDRARREAVRSEAGRRPQSLSASVLTI